MEIIKYENNELHVSKEASDKLKALYLAKAEFDVLMDRVKEELLKTMEENGFKSFENDFMKVTYKAPSVRKSIDTQALKDQGLYESFIKESPVKSSVVVSFK